MADDPTRSSEPATLTASIDDGATGLWQITTATGSVYLLDLDQRLLTRVPELRAMRRDHEPLHLHQLIEARVGASGRFLVQVRDDGIATIRLTSAIVAIDQLPPPPPATRCGTSRRLQLDGTEDERPAH
ncbi:hypothetical protein [Nocardioides ultimimeridianus]